MNKLLVLLILSLANSAYAHSDRHSYYDNSDDDATPSSTFIVGTCENGTQFSSVKSALDHVKGLPGSIGNHTIRVCPGTYDFGRHGYDIDDKDFEGLTLIGTSGNKADVIIQADDNQATLEIREDNVSLRYLTIKGDYRAIYTDADDTSLSDLTAISTRNNRAAIYYAWGASGFLEFSNLDIESQGDGIQIDNANNVTFEKVNITAPRGKGIDMQYSTQGDHRFIDLEIESKYAGIDVANSDDLEFSNITIDSASGYGIYLAYSADGDFDFSNITINAYLDAIQIPNGEDLSLDTLDLASVRDKGLNIGWGVSGDISISNATISARQEAIEINDGDSVTIENAIVSSSDDNGIYMGYGVEGIQRLENVTVTAENEALYISNGTAQLINSTFTTTARNRPAVELAYSASGAHFIQRSTFTSARDVGLEMQRGSGSIIEYNDFIDSEKGLKIDQYHASNITLRYNKFANNSDVGLDLEGSPNLIHQNCFINSDNADIRRSGNSFYQVGFGNYWGNLFNSGYSQLCADANEDNVCDAPYTDIKNVNDLYPLKSLTCGVDSVIEPLPEPNYTFAIEHNGFAVVDEYTEIQIRVFNEDGTLKTDYLGTVQVSTGVSRSDWKDLSDNNGTATYQFQTDDEGYVSLLVKFDDTQAAVDIDVTDGRASDDDSEGTLQIVKYGLTIGEPVYEKKNHHHSEQLTGINPVITPKLAGESFTLAIETEDSLLSYSSGGFVWNLLGSITNTLNNLLNTSVCAGTTYSMVFWAESDIANQDSANKVMVNGQAIPFGAQHLTASDVQSICFNDLAELDVKYKDVGKVRLFAKGIAEDNILGLKLDILGLSDLLTAILGQPRSIYGLSSKFVNYPYLTATRVDQRVTELTSDGAVFQKADEPFSMRVSAVDAEGDATPSFEQLSSEVTLQEIAYLGEETPALKVQLNSEGEWVNTLSASQMTSGSALLTNVRWPEVGAIQVQPMLNDFYQIPYLDIGSEDYKDDEYALDVFGRFIPNRFELTESEEAQLAGLCQDDDSAFHYYGQPLNFTSPPTINIKACATADECIAAKNYQGDLWKAGNGVKVEYDIGFKNFLGNDITESLIDPETGRLSLDTPVSLLGDTVSFLSHSELSSVVLSTLADTTQLLNDTQQSLLSSVLEVSSVTANLGLSDLTSDVLNTVTNTLNAAGEIELTRIHENGVFDIAPQLSLNSANAFVYNAEMDNFDYSNKALIEPTLATIQMRVSLIDTDFDEPTTWSKDFTLLMKQGRWVAQGDVGGPKDALEIKFKLQHYVGGNWEDSVNENCSNLEANQIRFVSGFDGVNNAFEYQEFGLSGTAEVPLLRSVKQEVQYANATIQLIKPQATGETVKGQFVELVDDALFKYSLTLLEPDEGAVGYVDVEALLDEDSWLQFPSRFELDPTTLTQAVGNSTTLTQGIANATILVNSASAFAKGYYRQPAAPVLSLPNATLPLPSPSSSMRRGGASPASGIIIDGENNE